jgi:hypothetical protein
MQVQQFLQDLVSSGMSNVDALNQLNVQFSIGVKMYPEDNIVLLDYNQIESPKAHPIVIECRSLILSISSFAVVSKKFDRFFNFGECQELYENFSFENAIAFEKADGSLIAVYKNPHTGVREISTRGMAKAEGEHVFGGTFREKVVHAFGFADEAAFQQSTAFDDRLSYVFEFCSPENRIVTHYEHAHMVLLTVNEHERELPQSESDRIASALSLGNQLNVRRPKVYSKSNSLAEMVDVANALQGLDEGFVVYDPTSGLRVKIKSQTYLIAHRLRGNNAIPTRKNILDLVLEGEVDEMLAYFPEMQKYIDPVVEEVNAFESEIAAVYETVRDIAEQKEFALAIKSVRGSGVLFSARKLNQEPIHVFNNMPIGSKLKIFGV